MKNEEKAIKFLKDIKGTVSILTHGDGDGVCVAAQMIRFLKSKGITPKIHIGEYDVWRVEELFEDESDYYIFLDFSIYEIYKKVKDKFKDKKILVVDHHPTKEIKSLIHVNPRIDDPNIYISASEVLYGILKKLDSGVEWIARVGGVSDYALKGTEDEEEASDLINAYKAVKGERALLSVLRFLVNAEDINDLLGEDRFQKTKYLMDKELERQTQLFESEAYGDVNFFAVKGKFRITTMLINKLFSMYPDRTLIFYRKRDDGWRISGRSGTHDLSKLFPKAVKGIGSGGGHPKASGAWTTDFEEFKERFLRMIRKS